MRLGLHFCNWEFYDCLWTVSFKKWLFLISHTPRYQFQFVHPPAPTPGFSPSPSQWPQPLTPVSTLLGTFCGADLAKSLTFVSSSESLLSLPVSGLPYLLHCYFNCFLTDLSKSRLVLLHYWWNSLSKIKICPWKLRFWIWVFLIYCSV